MFVHTHAIGSSSIVWEEKFYPPHLGLNPDTCIHTHSIRSSLVIWEDKLYSPHLGSNLACETFHSL
jgi:hypothetical protein